MSGVNKNIVILISGSGSNMAAIVKTAQKHHWGEQFGARVAAVISNKAEAKGLALLKDGGAAHVAIAATFFPILCAYYLTRHGSETAGSGK